MFSVTTVTQVNSIFVSYLAYQQTTLQYVAGNHYFDRALGGILSHTPSSNVPRNYARLFGLTGFVINYNAQRLTLETMWDSFTFDFIFGESQQLIQYMSYSYIFFYGSECQDCPGYNLVFNGTCVNFCPDSTYKTPENVCLSCGEGKHWNGI